MAGTLDDEHVANLLKHDAKKAAKTYELVGIDAFGPRRAKSGAPKPNTNFLRHIIRQTDSHNAALLAKEAEESNARLRWMNREKERARRHEANKKQKKAEGRFTPASSDAEARPKSSGRQLDRRGHGKERDNKSRRRDRGSSEEARYRRHRNGSEEARYTRHRDSSWDARRRKRHDGSDDDRSTRKRGRSRSSYSETSRHRHGEEDNYYKARRRDDLDGHRSRKRDDLDGHKGRRSISRSTSQSQSPPPRSDKHQRKHRSRDQPHSIERPSKSLKPSRALCKSSRRSASPAYDSDPLEAIVGPLPPPTQPTIRSRGRGAHKANSMGIESRFSSTYNPAIDVRPDSDADDDWGDALEVLKDRQRWQQQGADRLKAAGFSEAQVRKWERGGEQTDEDVVWTRKGQAREWDRGKVVDEDGDVELKADFGRLK